MTMTYEEFGVRAASIRDALLSISKTVDSSGLEKTLTELIKLHASQLNRCDFCIELHLSISRMIGIPERKIEFLSEWRKTDLFNPRERAALALTEKLTSLNDAITNVEASPETVFTSAEIVYLIATIGTINSWNRIAVGLQFPSSRSANGNHINLPNPE